MWMLTWILETMLETNCQTCFCSFVNTICLSSRLRLRDRYIMNCFLPGCHPGLGYILRSEAGIQATCVEIWPVFQWCITPSCHLPQARTTSLRQSSAYLWATSARFSCSYATMFSLLSLSFTSYCHTHSHTHTKYNLQSYNDIILVITGKTRCNSQRNLLVLHHLCIPLSANFNFTNLVFHRPSNV